MTSRMYDVCVYGATGFTGKIVAKYLSQKKDIKWAIAGRSAEKLAAIKEEIGSPAGMDVVIADSSKYETLVSMAEKSKVIASTVGPFMKYGEPLVRACVEAKTGYVDITGEYPFIREMIDKYHDKAEEKKVKIVTCCGYDCIPVDMGTFMVTEELSEVETVRSLCTKCNGGASGGTLASVGEMDKWAKKPENKEKAHDPYVLSPSTKAEDRVDKKMTMKKSIGWDSFFGTLSVPYFMVGIDNPLVRRSLGLRGVYCSYDEAMSIGAITRVLAFAIWHPVSMLGGLNPKPGEGPSESIQRDGSFEMLVKGVSKDGKTCQVKVTGLGDPGYAATGILLAESALCLALDKTPDSFGVLTASTAMGTALIRRLEATKSFTFSKI